MYKTLLKWGSYSIFGSSKQISCELADYCTLLYSNYNSVSSCYLSNHNISSQII